MIHSTLTLIYLNAIDLIYFTARNGRPEEEQVENTTVFQQPPDEIPQPIVQPFSCHFEDKWYREGEEFRMGPNGCSVCMCVDTDVKCNDDNCPPPTTTQKPTTTQRSTTQRPTTSTTTEPPTTTTSLPVTLPFVPGPIGEIGSLIKWFFWIEEIFIIEILGPPGERGDRGDRGEPVCLIFNILRFC